MPVDPQSHALLDLRAKLPPLHTLSVPEAREQFGPRTEIVLVLGRDAAERIAGWDYGKPGVFDDLVRRHRLLVAARNGEYQPDTRHLTRVSRLPMEDAWDEVSSSEVRRRIATGENWRDLVHPAIRGIIEKLYLEGISTCRSRKEK